MGVSPMSSTAVPAVKATGLKSASKEKSVIPRLRGFGEFRMVPTSEVPSACRRFAHPPSVKPGGLAAATRRNCPAFIGATMKFCPRKANFHGEYRPRFNVSSKRKKVNIFSGVRAAGMVKIACAEA
jgi:hypothetical protein